MTHRGRSARRGVAASVHPPGRSGWLVSLFLAVVLALATGVAYAGIGSHGYTNYDDPDYAADNVYVRSGLTIDGVRYAFTSFDCANWHPITWLSLMLDVELFGDSPGAHHWVSLALHVANALLLFAGLALLTGGVWRSILAAALF